MLFNTQYTAGEAHPGDPYKNKVPCAFLSRLTVLLFIALFTIAGSSYSQCLTNSLKINTGYNPATNTLIAPATGAGAVDPNWTITALSADHMAICGCMAGSNAIVVPPLPGWWHTMPTANWISFYNHTAYATDWGRNYTAQFTRRFITCDSGTYALDFDISDDNFITDISVDGVSTVFSQVNAIGNFLGHNMYHRTVHLPSCGVHAITINVTQESVFFGPDGNAFGLLIDGTVTAVSGIPSIVREDSTPCLSSSCIGLITGPGWVCQGATITLSNTATGTWSATGSAISVNAATGVVTGVTPGTGTVTFTTAGGCTASTVITVVGPPTISGPDVMCPGNTIAFTSSTPIGTWSSSGGTIGTTGLFTSGTVGTVVVSFTGQCGIATHVVTVLPLPVITGDSVCLGSTITLTSSESTGSWSNETGTIDETTGVLTGTTVGTIEVTYSGACTATHIVTVLPLPVITGDSVCLGSTITLTSSESTGTWSSGTGTINSATGELTGAAVGTVVVTVTGSACTATHIVTVLPLPVITGDSVCLGGTITLTSSESTGTWSSATGTIDATTGVLTGGTAGTVVVTFTGSACTATHIVTVIPLPVITGDSVCLGGTITLTSSGSTGTWSSGTGTIDETTGVLTGTTVGTVEVTFTGSCGTVTHIVTVLPLPVITGDSVCFGGTITLISSESTGTWSSATGTINSTTGELTGTPAGTVVVTFTGSACAATHTVTVFPLPIITGDSVVCLGGAVTLTSSDSTGTWSSSTGTIDATTGVLTGAPVGTVVVTYTGVCTATYVVNVIALPVILGGGDEICPGTPISLTGIPTTGTWSGGSASAYVTDMGMGNGEVTAVAAGTAVLTYTDGAGCYSTIIVTVHCPCAALDSALTTLTSTVDYKEGCTYTCTAATSPINGWSIAGYLWQVGINPPVWNPSTATTDVQTVTVPYSGTEVVSVTYYAVDSVGDTCTLFRTINLNCERQPCYNEDGTNLVVTTATDSMGNCVFTATATVSTTHYILGYEWSTTGGPATVVHSSATSDSYTFSLLSGGSTTVSVIVHIVDPFFGAGTSPCCDANLSQAVSCGGCKCFDSAATTITSAIVSSEECRGIPSATTRDLSHAQVGDQNTGMGNQAEVGVGNQEGCCYQVTVNAGLNQGCTIVSYDWDIDGTVTTTTSSATSDSRIIPVLPLGTVTIVVTIHAIDANGNPCDITRTITLDCGCHCLNEATTVLTYMQLSAKDCLAAGDDHDAHPHGLVADDLSATETAGGIGTSPLSLGCCYNVTIAAGLEPGCKIVSYTWDINGAITVVPTSATTYTQMIHLPDGGSADITVTITAIDSNGKECVTTRTLKLKCGCNCFDKRKTRIEYIKLPSEECRYKDGVKDGCCYKVTAYAAMMNKCKIVSYIWNVDGVVTTTYTSAFFSTRNIPVAPGGIVNITVIMTAIDEDGIPCTEVRTLRLTCGCDCFNEAGTTLSLFSPAIPRPSGCRYFATANASINEPCKIVSYTWESSVTSPFTIYTSALSDTRSFSVPYMGTLTVKVTICAVNADGDTCKIERTEERTCGTRTNPPCCFDTSRCTATVMKSMDIHGNCNFYFTASHVVSRGCRFIGYIWETPSMSTGLTTSATFSCVLPASGSMIVTVTYVSVTATGDTCKFVRLIPINCYSKFGKSAGGGGDDVPVSEQINVFPNPTDNQITVSSESIEINTIQVINVNGQKVGNYNYDHAKSATLSFDKLVPGTYMLRINNEISKVVVKDR